MFVSESFCSSRARSCLGVPIVIIASLGLWGCSGDSSDVSPSTSQVGVRFSDAPVERASEVTIKVDRMTFVPETGDSIVVEEFTSSEMATESADTFSIDLLDYTGENSLRVLDEVKLPVGTYKNLLIDVIDEDTAHSWVLDEPMGSPKQLKVPSGVLKLGSFEVSDRSVQELVIEFGLRSALTYNPGPDRYILKPHGVRIVGLAEAASLSVEVDPALCPAVQENALSAIVYAYAGRLAAESVLGDVNLGTGENGDSDSIPDESEVSTEAIMRPVDSLIADFDEDEADGSGTGLFHYLVPGDYTVALACTDNGDDPDTADMNIVIPSPAGALTTVSLASGQSKTCRFESADPSGDVISDEPVITCE